MIDPEAILAAEVRRTKMDLPPRNTDAMLREVTESDREMLDHYYPGEGVDQTPESGGSPGVPEGRAGTVWSGPLRERGRRMSDLPEAEGWWEASMVGVGARRWVRGLVVGVVVALVASACGGGEDSSPVVETTLPVDAVTVETEAVVDALVARHGAGDGVRAVLYAFERGYETPTILAASLDDRLDIDGFVIAPSGDALAAEGRRLNLIVLPEDEAASPEDEEALAPSPSVAVELVGFAVPMDPVDVETVLERFRKEVGDQNALTRIIAMAVSGYTLEQILNVLVSTSNVRLDPFNAMSNAACVAIFDKDAGEYVRPAGNVLNPECQLPDRTSKQDTGEPTDDGAPPPQPAGGDRLGAVYVEDFDSSAGSDARLTLSIEDGSDEADFALSIAVEYTFRRNSTTGEILCTAEDQATISGVLALSPDGRISGTASGTQGNRAVSGSDCSELDESDTPVALSIDAQLDGDVVRGSFTVTEGAEPGAETEFAAALQ